MTRRTALRVLAVAGCLTLAGASASVVVADEPQATFTILGRGYAAVVGYPIDEVPPTGEDDEEPAEHPPDQTCPEDERGVAPATAARLDSLADPGQRKPTEPTLESDSPTPRGQPIRFTFGLADGSLRSDPGVHGIAAGFYVDLGGAQDPWTSVETDGYVSGHAREQERCGNLYAGEAGNAEQVHVLSRALPGPYTFDYTHLRRTIIPGVGTFESSVTRVEMDGRSLPVTGSIVTTVEGITLFDEVRADSVTSVIDYRTDGTPDGTAVTTWSTAEGVTVGGEAVAVTVGAAPVTEDAFVLGVSEPQVRQLDNGSVQVEAGGFYVGADVANPLGLQAKQGVSLGGARLSASAFPAASRTSSGGTPPPATDPPPPASSSPPAASRVESPITSTTTPVAPTAPSPPAVAAPGVTEPAEPLVSVRRIGVYVTPRQATGAVGLVALTLLALLGTTGVWLRARSWRFRVLLGAPGLRWMDRAYRAFMRG